jgi:hypothetical protein
MAGVLIILVALIATTVWRINKVRQSGKRLRRDVWLYVLIAGDLLFSLPVISVLIVALYVRYYQ